VKELKISVTLDLNKGFNDIIQLLNVYKLHLDSNINNSKELEMESFIFEHMETLKSLCLSHFSKIQSDLVSSVLDWKNRKNQQKEKDAG
jgi:hypothetical protein